MARHDFTLAVKDVLAKRVGTRCSKPECRIATTGPHDDPAKATNVGVAAHITAASSRGPRFNKRLTEAQRRSADNGIWLCQNHAKRIDNEPKKYTESVLRQWKAVSEWLLEQGIDDISQFLNAAKARLAPETSKKSIGDEWTFDQKTGIWTDPSTQLTHCPKCKSDGKASPLKSEEHGFKCHVCGGYFDDPARPRRHANLSLGGFGGNRGGGGWMGY